MADEKLALDIYLNAFNISNNSTPDVKLYATIHLLKSISGFRFRHENIDKIIVHLQEECIKVADIFPFFKFLNSNIYLLEHEEENIIFMRKFLNELINTPFFDKKFAEVIEEFKQTGITEEELISAKRQLESDLLLGLETSYDYMTRNAKNEIIYGRERTIEEALELLSHVTVEQVNAQIAATFNQPHAKSIISNEF